MAAKHGALIEPREVADAEAEDEWLQISRGMRDDRE